MTAALEETARCYGCWRPREMCFCHTIPAIDNRTAILLLQHVGERAHPFNTARIVNRSLRQCDLLTDHNCQFANRPLPIRPDAGLLYPGSGARPLDELPTDERPGQLVVIDGTWSQARTIVRDNRALQALPRYELRLDTPGQYRIRREPNRYSLSTIEAVVSALRTLEPDTAGWDALLAAFHTMVDEQLAHPASRTAWRKNSRRQGRPRNVPRALLESEQNIVVVYGEATPRRIGASTTRAPLTWAAQRLGDGCSFSCALTPQGDLLAQELEHIRLTQADFDAALTHSEFSDQWLEFLRPADTIVAYHQRTIELLRTVCPTTQRCLVLKSTFGRRHGPLSSLERLAELEDVAIPARSKTRTAVRLEIAVQLVRRLQQQSVRDEA